MSQKKALLATVCTIAGIFSLCFVIGLVNGSRAELETKTTARIAAESVYVIFNIVRQFEHPLVMPERNARLVYERDGTVFYAYDITTQKLHVGVTEIRRKPSFFPLNADDFITGLSMGALGSKTVVELASLLRKGKHLKGHKSVWQTWVASIAAVISGYALGYWLTAPTYHLESIEPRLNDPKLWDEIARTILIRTATTLKTLARSHPKIPFEILILLEFRGQLRDNAASKSKMELSSLSFWDHNHLPVL